MSMWGPWIYEGVPKIGTYVQVEAVHEPTGATRKFEGIIAGYDGTIGWFTWSTSEDIAAGRDYQALRWRERRLREFEAERHKEEIEA